MTKDEERQQNEDLLQILSEIPAEREDAKNWLFQKILDGYKEAQDSLALTKSLFEKEDIWAFLNDLEDQLVEEEYSGKEIIRYTKMIDSIRTISKDDQVLISEDAGYLLKNFPEISTYSTFVKFALAIGIGLTNGIKATITKHGLTGYLAFQATKAESVEEKALLVTLASINALTSNPPFPSISRLISYVDFTIIEEILFRIYKKKDKDEILKFDIKNFVSPGKLSLMLEGSGIFILIPLEILRMFELEEVSPKMLRVWRKIHQLRKLQSPKK